MLARERQSDTSFEFDANDLLHLTFLIVIPEE